MKTSVRESVIEVFRALRPIYAEFVLVGGSAVHFLVPPTAAADIRPTEDVDLVVAVESNGQMDELGGRLRTLGFAECRDEGAPICRWVVGGILVDIMPTRVEVLGFTNRWYEHALARSQELELESGLHCKRIDVVTFLATKFEALASRGGDDHFVNADFEDIISVIAYGVDLPKLVEEAPDDLKGYLKERALFLLQRQDLSDSISGCLPGNHWSQELVPEVIACLKSLAALELR